VKLGWRPWGPGARVGGAWGVNRSTGQNSSDVILCQPTPQLNSDQLLSQSQLLARSRTASSGALIAIQKSILLRGPCKETLLRELCNATSVDRSSSHCWDNLIEFFFLNYRTGDGIGQGGQRDTVQNFAENYFSSRVVGFLNSKRSFVSWYFVPATSLLNIKNIILHEIIISK